MVKLLKDFILNSEDLPWAWFLISKPIDIQVNFLNAHHQHRPVLRTVGYKGKQDTVAVLQELTI